MWTEEKLKEAAKDYRNNFNDYPNAIYLEWAFLDGCKYIINNTQKDE